MIYKKPTIEPVALEMERVIATSNVRQYHIAVLGNKAAGKTTMLCIMQNKEYSPNDYAQTFGTPTYEAFEYTNLHNEIIHIATGQDIGGGVDYEYYYEHFIQRADYIFYLFNLEKYLDNIDYRKDVISRLYMTAYFMNKHMKTISHLAIILTHKDVITEKMLDPEETKCKFTMEYEQAMRQAGVSFTKSVHFANTTDKNEIKNIIDSVLK